MTTKIVIADTQKYKILNGGQTYLNSLEMRLFKANITPTGTVQPAYPSDEVTDSGYAPVANPFPSAATTVGTVGRCVGVNPTFMFDHNAGDFTVYGVFFTDPADSDVTVFSQRADSPFTCVAAGQVFVVDALFDADSIP